MTAAAAAEGTLPPVAPRRPHIVKVGKVEGEERGEHAFDPPRELVDDFFWLRDDKRESPEVLAHLRAENAYTEAQTAHLDKFRESLYRELLSHVQETDDSAPYPHGPYDYYTRTIEGLSYVIHCRKPKGTPPLAATSTDVERKRAKELVLLDENELAKAFPDHCDVGAVEPSPSHKLLAWSVDGKGYETYSIHFKALADGQPMSDVLTETAGDLVWGGDDTSIYYTTFDAAHRPNAVWRHVLGTKQADDQQLFEEPDGLFYVSLAKSRDGRLLLVNAHSTETSEVRFLDLAKAPASKSGSPPELRVVQPRQFKLRYSVSHRDEHLFITTNEGEAHNQKVVTAPLATPSMEHWAPLADVAGKPVLPHDASRTISHASCFADHLVLSGREGGLTQVWVLDMAGTGPAVKSFHRVQWPEAAYECGLGPNEEFHTRALRLSFSSPVSPRRSISYDMASRRMSTVKETAVPNYNPALYATARRQLEARDGTLVPVTLLWRKDKVDVVGSADEGAPSSPAPLHLYGYGSYGMCVEPSFSSRVLPLVDRGVVFAIAHVRGGSENGRWQWYEEAGKYLAKRNTFNDFVDVAAALARHGWTEPARMSCEGRSAGGLLIGNVINIAPHLFRAAIAGVPFVDLVVTMCDPSIPLTTGEWEEWGNPNQPKCAPSGKPRARGQPVTQGPPARAQKHTRPSGALITRRAHAPRTPAPARVWCAQVLRVHALLLADQPGQGAGLPQRARHLRAARPSGRLLGASQVGAAPASQAHQQARRRQEDLAQDGPLSRPLLGERSVQVPARARVRLRLAARRAQPARQGGAPGCSQGRGKVRRGRARLVCRLPQEQDRVLRGRAPAPDRKTQPDAM
jgi:oligopeptidase B